MASSNLESTRQHTAAASAICIFFQLIENVGEPRERDTVDGSTESSTLPFPSILHVDLSFHIVTYRILSESDTIVTVFERRID